MVRYELHDCSSSTGLKLLQDNFSRIDDPNLIKNYHPDYRGTPGNFFTVLDEGRYARGYGKYYVIEEGGAYICSAGWNRYQVEPDTALLLTRMYVDPHHRGKYTVGKHIFPLALEEARIDHSRLWVTFNGYNAKWRKWFETVKVRGLVPDHYKNFNYIGILDVYYTQQYVYEYCTTPLVVQPTAAVVPNT